jgi:hypothetical protein
VLAADTAAGPDTTTAGSARVAALVDQARRRYDAAIQAQRDLDWATYGEEMRRLGELLRQLGQSRPAASP